ncbi:telomere stability and silencing-domain-containing protein, partial [Dimargaris cristalligena]
LRGGKGGFGSMLRAQGGKMATHKTTNFDACRDLSGRRLLATKEVDATLRQLDLADELAIKRKDRIRKRIQKGLQEPVEKKHRFDDPHYFAKTETIAQNVKLAVRKAVRQSDKNRQVVEGRSESPSTSPSSSSSSSSLASAASSDAVTTS